MGFISGFRSMGFTREFRSMGFSNGFKSMGFIMDLRCSLLRASKLPKAQSI